MPLRSWRTTILTGVAIAAFSGASWSAAFAHPATDVVASNWKFTPATVEAHIGEATSLNLTSSEGVHGIESADLGIPMTMIAPNKTTAVTFTPKKAGTFPVHCAVVCGAGHENMILTVTVVP